MKGFYGHVMLYPATRWTPREFRYYTQGIGSVMGLMLNCYGLRFCDESLEDHQNAQRILEQPNARALLVFDRSVHMAASEIVWPNDVAPTDTFEVARAEGGHAVKADSWEALFEQTATWGYDPKQALATVTAYNRDAARGVAPRAPARIRQLRTYLEAPFYAVEGQVGVTATHGGLRVDPQARVLDAFGRPVPGLLAAGADAGNIYFGGYAGGLNFAATFGLLAADHAIGRVRRS